MRLFGHVSKSTWFTSNLGKTIVDDDDDDDEEKNR